MWGGWPYGGDAGRMGDEEGGSFTTKDTDGDIYEEGGSFTTEDTDGDLDEEGGSFTTEDTGFSSLPPLLSWGL